MFIAIRCSKFRMGMSTTEKDELTAVLYLFLCCKPNINDLIHTALSINHYPKKMLSLLKCSVDNVGSRKG